MQIIHRQGWALIPDGDSFLFYSMNQNGHSLGYFLYTFPLLKGCSEEYYFRVKYGPQAAKIMEYFGTDFTDSVKLPNGTVYVVYYQDSDIHKFAPTGELVWIGGKMGDVAPIHGIAIEGESIWCVYPEIKALKRFSLLTSAEEVSLQGDFSQPESIIIYGQDLFLADMGNYRIWKIDLHTLTVEEYRRFSEPVMEYLQANGHEVVRLCSGIYLL